MRKVLISFLITVGLCAPAVVRAQDCSCAVGSQVFQVNLFLATPSSPDGVAAADVNRVFASGDRFRVVITPRRNGYVYVVLHGSQGNVQVLFPSDSQGNAVEAGGSYIVPGEHEWFRFDQYPGVEDLYLVRSATPIDFLEMARGSGGVLTIDQLLLLQRLGNGEDFEVQLLQLRHESVEEPQENWQLC